jgi:predicted metal-dependent hydrolase
MEELWLEEGRNPLLQGLLQAAVGLHHWDNGNPSGASKLMIAALDKLDGYADEVVGIDLGQLRQDLKSSLNSLSSSPHDALFQAFELIIKDESLKAAVAAWENRIK